jgi:hypothetical protein
MSPEIDILPFLTGLSQGLRGLALFAGVILILDSIILDNCATERQ